LYDALTINAATAWGLNSGKIAAGRDADLVVAKMKSGSSTAHSFFALEPADILLVLHKGNIVLFDEELYIQLKELNHGNYHRICINGIAKYVHGNLPELMQRITQYYPEVSFPVI
jgi:hypothetical protein